MMSSLLAILKSIPLIANLLDRLLDEWNVIKKKQIDHKYDQKDKETDRIKEQIKRATTDDERKELLKKLSNL